VMLQHLTTRATPDWKHHVWEAKVLRVTDASIHTP
jgi:hypothetical protein